MFPIKNNVKMESTLSENDLGLMCPSDCLKENLVSVNSGAKAEPQLFQGQMLKLEFTLT